MLDSIKSTLKNTAIYSIGNLSVKLVGIVLLPFYTNPHYLSIDAYGALGLFEAVNQILVIVLGLGLSNSLVRWYYDIKSGKEQKELVFSIWVGTALATIPITILILLLKRPLTHLTFGDYKYTYEFTLLLIATAMQVIGLIPMTLMRMQEKAGLYTTSNVIRLGTMLAATLILLIYFKRGLAGIIEAQIIGHIAYFIVITPYSLKNISFRFRFSLFKPLLNYGVPIMFAGLAGIALTTLDRFIINGFYGLDQVSLYSLGVKVANVIKVFIIGSVSLALSPIIFKKMNDSDNKRFYSKAMTYYGFGIMICILFLSLFAQEAIKVLSSSKYYWKAFGIVPVVAFSFYFTALRDVAVTGIHLTKRTRILTGITVTTAIVNLILNFALIPWLKSMGAAIALSFSQFFFFVATFFFSQRQYHVPYEVSKLVKMFLIGVGLFVLGYLCSSLHLWLRLTLKLLLIFSFPFLLYPINFYEPIELQRMGEIWKKWRNPLGWPIFK